MGMDKLLASKKKLDEINSTEGKRKVIIREESEDEEESEQKSFEERHERLTTYVENNLHRKIKQMKKTGKIRTITEFVNRAFKEYLEKNF